MEHLTGRQQWGLTGHEGWHSLCVPPWILMPGPSLMVMLTSLDADAPSGTGGTSLGPQGKRAALTAWLLSARHSTQLKPCLCTPAPTPYPLSCAHTKWAFSWDRQWCRKVFIFPLEWDTSLFSSSREKKKTQTPLLNFMGFKPAAPRCTTCRKPFTPKPQEPDDHNFWFQPPSIFSDQHLPTGMLSHRETLPGPFTRGFCLLEILSARLSWSCPASRWEQFPPYFHRNCSLLCPGVAEPFGGLVIGLWKGERHQKEIFPGLKKGWHRALRSGEAHPGLQR